MKRKQPSPRRPKPKKCAECETNMSKLAMAEDQLLVERLAHKISVSFSGTYAAERDEFRKQHLVAAQRNVELTEENRKLQAFKDLALGLAQRDLAGNLHIKAEDAKNCLQ